MTNVHVVCCCVWAWANSANNKSGYCHLWSCAPSHMLLCLPPALPRGADLSSILGAGMLRSGKLNIQRSLFSLYTPNVLSAMFHFKTYRKMSVMVLRAGFHIERTSLEPSYPVRGSSGSSVLMGPYWVEAVHCLQDDWEGLFLIFKSVSGKCLGHAQLSSAELSPSCRPAADCRVRILMFLSLSPLQACWPSQISSSYCTDITSRPW